MQELREVFLAAKKIIRTDYLLLALLCLCLFWALSNLFLKLNDQTGFVHGLQIDYLIPKLYLLDIFTAGWVGIYAWQYKNRWLQFFQVLFKKKVVLFVLSLLIPVWFLAQLWTPFPMVGWLTLTRYALYVTFFLGVWNFIQLHPGSDRVIKAVFLSGLAFQLIIGFFQFFFQRSLTPYWLLGEPQLLAQPGLARASFSWLDDLLGTYFGLRMLPYGTFPHPNVLAGFLALGVLVLAQLQLKQVWQKALKLVGFLGLGLLLFLTQSISAWLFLFLGLTSPFLRKKVPSSVLVTIFGLGFVLIPLALSITANSFSSTSILRRHWLNQASWQLWQESPLLGVGARQVTAQIETATQTPEVVAFVQPAHHVGILFLAENGLLGIAVVLLFLFILHTKYSILPTLLPLIPLLTLDHYLLSFPQGWWLVFLYGYLINSSLSSRTLRHPELVSGSMER